MSRRASARVLAHFTKRQFHQPSISIRSFTTSFRPFQQQSTTSPPPLPSSPREASANAARVAQDLSPSSDTQPLRDLSAGLSDPLPDISEDGSQVDWTKSFHGLSSVPFTPEQAAILQQDIPADDIEIKPDGIIYLPEIKYRRILNKTFGPGGWGLAPRGETIVTGKLVTREYGLVCGGRLVSIARGEQAYFDKDGIPTATEGCKSNALMRCCKDLGIASELWDPRYVRRFIAENAREVMVEHVVTKKRRKHWMRKDDELRYPLKEVPAGQGFAAGIAASQGNGNGNGGAAAAAAAAKTTATTAGVKRVNVDKKAVGKS